jgi:hypothetical protein
LRRDCQASVVGVAVWCKGVTYKHPMRFDVLSPALDSSAFGAHNALLAVLEELKKEGKLDGITGMNVWSDNGGHFTAGAKTRTKPAGPP